MGGGGDGGRGGWVRRTGVAGKGGRQAVRGAVAGVGLGVYAAVKVAVECGSSCALAANFAKATEPPRAL